jgi:hypothetical protein
MRSYLQYGYRLERTSVINPFDISVSFESGKSFQKTSVELNYKYSYIGKKNGLDIRFFAGTMLKNDASDPIYAFSACGRSGRELYMFEGVYPNRFSEFPKTFFSRQMSLSEGGLVSPINDTLGYSRSLYSITLTSTLPGIFSKIPVNPFMNLVLTDHGLVSGNKSPLFFEAGLKAGFRGYFEIYFPLIVSDNISSIRSSLKDRIRFIFRLDKLNSIRSKS